MGLKSTGNGRRQSYAHAPMPRMTNTYMQEGNENPQNLIQDLKDGLYAVGFGGGQVDITNGKFVFSCTEAYRVKNGKIEEAVNGATLIGDGASALKKIKTIGFSGFKGGYLNKNSSISLHVTAMNYGISEDSHHILMHILLQYLIESVKK